MAYREVDMWEILEVLRRCQRGESKAAIKRATGRTRKTVRRYVDQARAVGWDGTSEPDEALAVAVARRLKPGTDEPREGTSAAALTPHRERIRGWLFPEAGRGLRLAKVHELLGRQNVDVPYSSLHRFVVAHLSFRDRRRTTVRVAEVAPGELAEVDFGRLGLVPDPATGTRRVVHALLVTLGYSRHQYVHVTPSQQIPDLVCGIEDAWEYFGATDYDDYPEELSAYAMRDPDRMIAPSARPSSARRRVPAQPPLPRPAPSTAARSRSDRAHARPSRRTSRSAAPP
jgi:hypothetical protein